MTLKSKKDKNVIDQAVLSMFDNDKIINRIKFFNRLRMIKILGITRVFLYLMSLIIFISAIFSGLPLEDLVHTLKFKSILFIFIGIFWTIYEEQRYRNLNEIVYPSYRFYGDMEGHVIFPIEFKDKVAISLLELVQEDREEVLDHFKPNLIGSSSYIHTPQTLGYVAVTTRDLYKRKNRKILEHMKSLSIEEIKDSFRELGYIYKEGYVYEPKETE